MTDNVDFDVYSDPNNPVKIKYDDILAASRRIVGAISKTPCMTEEEVFFSLFVTTVNEAYNRNVEKAHMSERLGMDVYLKQEFLQMTGSFKERGVRNALMCLTDDQKKYGVVTASTGNHGIAMCYHATQLGIPCIVVMPAVAAITKVTRCEATGAKIVLFGAHIVEARRHAMTIAKERKMTYINGFDHPHIIEGHGSLGIEIIDQVSDVDAILIPVGGGALLTGTAIAVKHLKPDTEIYGIETDKTNTMVETLKKNGRFFFDIESTIADGLAINMVGVNSFYNIKGIVDKMIVVKEDWVARAIMHIVEEERFIVEGAGAVSIAAVMAGLFPNLKGKKVVCIMTGGNIDTTVLARVLERAMAVEGRLVKFKVTVSDRPGGMAELCNLLGGIGVTMRDCIPERAWVKGDVFSVELKVIAEARGWDHAKELIDLVKKNYKEYYFADMSERTDKLPANKRGPCLAPNPVCMQK